MKAYKVSLKKDYHCFMNNKDVIVIANNIKEIEEVIEKQLEYANWFISKIEMFDYEIAGITDKKEEE